MQERSTMTVPVEKYKRHALKIGSYSSDAKQGRNDTTDCIRNSLQFAEFPAMSMMKAACASWNTSLFTVQPYINLTTR